MLPIMFFLFVIGVFGVLRLGHSIYEDSPTLFFFSCSSVLYVLLLVIFSKGQGRPVRETSKVGL